MRDLQIAKQALKAEGFTLVIVREGNILFKTGAPGIRGFLSAVDLLGSKMEGASAADRTVGRAVALLCLHTRIETLFAYTISGEAVAVLEESGVHVEYEKRVPHILDAEKNVCPFERAVMGIQNPKIAYEKLKEACRKLDGRNRVKEK